MTIINYLTVFLAAFPTFSTAQESETIKLSIGNGYYVYATCHKTNKNDSNITLRPKNNTRGNKNTLSLIGPDNGCDAIALEDFNGDGVPEISITYGNEATSTQKIFFINPKKQTITYGGSIPVGSSKLNDGSYQYETISYGSAIKSTIVFIDKEFIVKKTTQLVFDGRTCLNSAGEIERYGNCPNGPIATPNNPICFEREHGSHFKPIKLEDCSIDKSKVLQLHE